MVFYFAWIKESEEFSIPHHCRQDEKIFDLKIQHKEGNLPQAIVQMTNPKMGLLNPLRQQYCFISTQTSSGEVKLLFKGRVIGFPIALDKEIITLQFIAGPSDRKEKLKTLCSSLKQAPYWDDLFVAEEDQDKATEILEARSALFCWSRTEDTVILSDVLTGRQSFNIQGNFYRESLQLRVEDPPLESVSVEVSVEWLQRYQNVDNITPFIVSTEGLIGTLTGEDFPTRWWKIGDKIGETGYEVVYADLREAKPATFSVPLWTGPEPKVPRTSFEETLTPPELSVPRKIRFQCRWFRPTLVLGWTYRQKRREIAYFTLQHATQSLIQANRCSRKLRLVLQDIVGANSYWQPNSFYTKEDRVLYQGYVYVCLQDHPSEADFKTSFWKQLSKRGHISDQSYRGTFFLTDRGRQALEHAMEIARAHLALSARAIKVKFTVDFEKLLEINLDTTITLQDDRLPGAELTGKVIEYEMHADGHTGTCFIHVSLGVSIGKGDFKTKLPSPEDPEAHYSTSEVLARDYQAAGQKVFQTASGIVYQSWDQQSPTEGILFPQMLEARDLVQSVEINNTWDVQQEHLMNNQYPVRHNLVAVLKEIPTQVRIVLKNLTTTETLVHKIQVKILSPWSAPQHISLAASARETL